MDTNIDSSPMNTAPHVPSGPHRPCSLRRARLSDAPRIQALIDEIYQGTYPLAADTDIARDIADPAAGLWLIAETQDSGQLVACMGFRSDPVARVAWSGGGGVRPEFRGSALAATLLSRGIGELTGPEGPADVVFGTSRTAASGPARMVERAGYVPVGFLPNATRILGRLEHLHVDGYFTRRALLAERPAPRLLPAVLPVYAVVAAQLGLPRLAPAEWQEGSATPAPSAPARGFSLETDPFEIARIVAGLAGDAVPSIWKPLAHPNAALCRPGSPDVVLLHLSGQDLPASILGLHAHDEAPAALLAAACAELDRHGAIFVDLWADASAAEVQAAALGAGLLPSGYFPVLRRTPDGRRRDAVIFSRTFRQISFQGASINRRALPLLRLYLSAGDADPIDTAALGVVKASA